MNQRRKIVIALALSFVSFAVRSPELAFANEIPAGMKLVSVEAWPSQLTLSAPWQVAQILITGKLDSGEQIDLTQVAQLETKTAMVAIDPFRRVAPQEDGHVDLNFTVHGHQVRVAVDVRGMRQQHHVSYVREVTPSLSKMGCNAGTCHGSKDGQVGFKLSLRGYDFLYDHRALTDDIGARRFNRANPEQSLMLLKASGSIPHVGGVLTKPGERHYQLLKRWIADGAPLDIETTRVTGIRLIPASPILPRANLTQQMIVMATYEDGSERDVTADAFIESGDIEILSADKRGLVTTLRRGEAPLLARYEGAYTAATVTIMGDRSEFQWKQPPSYTDYDALVYEKLQRVKIEAADVCTDDEFVRRVYLDLTGLPPSASVVRDFLNDGRASRAKRDQLVDRLVGSPAYVEHWTNKWADLLQVNRKFLGELGATSLRNWIQASVASNKPYDQFAYEVLTGSGSTFENPAAAYWKTLREPADAMENTTHLFLAVRFNCNKCHDHPFERWTQDQYYNMTAFFAQVDRKEDPEFAGERIGGSAVEQAAPLVEIVFDSGKGETTHDRTGQISAPSFPYDNELVPESGARRERLARWITSANNRYFASSYVNRLWGYLLGVGLIEPIDDIRAGNPATNRALLDVLTRDFVASNFDVQSIVKKICKSRVYQHSVRTTRWNEDDAINYSHALPRRLPAEVLFDAIHFVVGSPSRLPGVPAGLRAAQLPDAGVSLPFLDDFGRPPRESSCECERTTGIVLGPIMKLVNGPTVNNAIADETSQLAKLVIDVDDDEKLIDELFMRIMARHPSANEQRLGVDALKAAKADVQLAETSLNNYRTKKLAALNDWLGGLPKPAEWSVIQPGELSGEHATLVAQDDHSILASGSLQQDTYSVIFDGLPVETAVTGLRIELLPDASLASGGPGRAPNGNVVLSELTLATRASPAADWRPLQLQNAMASFSQSDWPVAAAIDGNPQTGWGIMPRFNQAHAATFELAHDAKHAGGAGQLRVQIAHHYPDGKHNVGRFRLSLTASKPPFATSDLPETISTIVASPQATWTETERKVLSDYYLTLDPEFTRLSEVLAMSRQQARQHRLTGVQDLAWALINTPAFLFNR